MHGYYYGFTSNYIPLKLSGNYQINEIYKIKLRKEDINLLIAVLDISSAFSKNLEGIISIAYK